MQCPHLSALFNLTERTQINRSRLAHNLHDRLHNRGRAQHLSPELIN
jgi:hypothetical protein